jgi:hypothetical protein
MGATWGEDAGGGGWPSAGVAEGWVKSNIARNGLSRIERLRCVFARRGSIVHGNRHRG